MAPGLYSALVGEFIMPDSDIAGVLYCESSLHRGDGDIALYPHVNVKVEENFEVAENLTVGSHGAILK
jgi:hypothetical protein